jgi:FkbM family methyltransferase
MTGVLHSVAGRLGLAYALHVPQHRGKFRMLEWLDRVLGPFDLRTRDGRLLLRVFLSSSMDQSYFRAEPPSAGVPKVADLVRALEPGDAYVDVGANCGFLALTAARATGPQGLVIAFEPCAREFIRLLASVSLNRAGNVVCIRAALGACNGVRELEVASGHTGLNRLKGEGGRRDPDRTELVPCHPGDSALPGLLAGRRVKLVKVDVEGAELEVLRGMRRWLGECRPPTVVVEITPCWLESRGDSKAALYSLMADLGYRPTVRGDRWQYDEVFVADAMPRSAPGS